MAFTKSQVIIIGIGLLIFLFVALLFIGVIPGLRSTERGVLSGSLIIWGVADSGEQISSTIISQYQSLNPGVSITYVQKNAATYEEELINALASGKGPDAYFIKNTWVLDQAERLTSLSEDQYSLRNLRAAFPSVVEQDVVVNNSTIFGFPLAIDTLALFYNRALFDNAGIATPPTTWEQVQKIIPRLRSIDASQRLVRYAIALGGSQKSVSRASDILSLMMLQDGVAMNEEGSISPNFARDGEKTLRRYLAYSNPASEYYTWDDSGVSDTEAFASGKLAMMIGYREDAARISEKNPFLDFEMAPLPQNENADLATHYASYWLLVTPKTSRNSGLAWDFIGTVTLNPQIAQSYSSLTGKTPALRSLIAEAMNTPISFFPRQALSAKSWKQPSGSQVEEILSKMIESILAGKIAPREALTTAQESIDDIIRRRIQAQN